MITNQNEFAPSADSRIPVTQTIVGVADSNSKLPNYMSDSKGGFQNGNRIKEYTDIETSSQPPLHQRLKEYRKGTRDENPMEDIPDWVPLAWIFGILLLEFISFWFLVSGEFLISMLLILPLFILAVFTNLGREIVAQIIHIFKQAAANADQNQATFGAGKKKLTCPSCGWQNPDGNNYCHDCGSELAPDN